MAFQSNNWRSRSGFPTNNAHKTGPASFQVGDIVWLPARNQIHDDRSADFAKLSGFNHYHLITAIKGDIAYAVLMTSFDNRPVEMKYYGTRERSRYVAMKTTEHSRPHPDTGFLLSVEKTGSPLAISETSYLSITTLRRIPLRFFKTCPHGSARLTAQSLAAFRSKVRDFKRSHNNTGFMDKLAFDKAYEEATELWGHEEVDNVVEQLQRLRADRRHSAAMSSGAGFGAWRLRPMATKS